MTEFFTEKALLRVLNSAKEEETIGAIISSDPYNVIVQSQNDAIDTLIDVLFDQFGIFGDQLSELFGNAFKEVVSLGLRPGAELEEYDPGSSSLIEQILSLLTDLIGTGEKEDLKELVEQLEFQISRLKQKVDNLEDSKRTIKLIIKIQRDYLLDKCSESNNQDQRYCGAAFYFRGIWDEIKSL